MLHTTRLTHFSRGGGCGCKIAPDVLGEILQGLPVPSGFSNLLIGLDQRDDAAAYAISSTEAIVSTVDFFTPVVDDASDFGAIAAANALSDVYAMGARPLFALAVLGWPMGKLSTHVAADVLRGASETCSRAGVVIAGGHSIDSQEPIFGLSVTGRILTESLRRNSMARAGCILFLTKSLGVGILSTAEKRGLLLAEDREKLLTSMLRLNDAGPHFAELDGVATMTDVTGYGLAGHLIEVCEASNLRATLEVNKLPLMDNVNYYIELGTVPGGTQRNYRSYGAKLSSMSAHQITLLCDPQTSGGLLVAVEESAVTDFLAVANEQAVSLTAIGYLSPPDPGEPLIRLV